MPSDYSTLESLLLFQYLYSYGSILPTAFARLSDQLKNDPNIRAAPKYDASRFTPDALRDFFLSNLNDEVKRTSSTSDPDATNGTSAQTRKRKAPTPPLPSLQDATNNLHLVPQLILKLYSQYRQQAVADIREDERLHEKYTQEVVEIERGDWDVRLQKGLEEQEKRRFPGLRSNGDLRTSSSPQPPRKPERPSPAHLEPTQPSNHAAQRTPSPTSTTIELPKTVPRHPPPQVVIQKAPPLQIQPSPSPISSQSPFGTTTAGQTQPHSKGSTSVERPASPLVSAQATKSPTIGPAKIQPVQPTRTPSQPQVSPPKFPPASFGQPSVSPTGTPGPARPNQQQSYVSAPYPSQRGGVMLQPFQVSPQIPTPFTKQPQLPTTLQQTTTPIQPRTLGPIRGGTSTPVTVAARPSVQPSPLILSITRALSNPNLKNTPPSTPSNFRRSIGTSWKNAESLSYGSRSPERPRSISPIDDRMSTTEQISTVRKRRQKPDQLTALDRPSTRSGRASSRRIRGASTASSVMGSSVRGRTRSQSVASHTSADDSASKTVKHEPPSTPMDTSEMMVDDTPMPAPPRRGPSKRTKRKRSVAASEASAPDLGRGSTADADNLPESDGPTTVLAVRNFPRLSSSKFNEIISHKHASVFSKPVHDKDAAGYSSMIRRPTDLKTIKAQIQAGSRAVNADETASASTSPAILLPWSEDLVPPKAIVNSGQLEKELMRMFANAVMFNPGEEDVVRDAREMFEQTVVEVMQFREAEKGAETAVRKENEAVVEDEDEGTPATAAAGSKRRRVG